MGIKAKLFVATFPKFRSIHFPQGSQSPNSNCLANLQNFRLNPDTVVGMLAYVEVALEGDGHQGVQAAGESNLK